MTDLDRIEHFSLVDVVAPIVVPLAIVCVYIGNGTSVWMTVGAIIVFGLIGIGYLYQRDVRKAVLTFLCVAIFAPSIANFHALVPIFGAVLLVIYSWRQTPLRRRRGTTTQLLPITCTAVVTIGVIAFQAINSSRHSGFEWLTLPGAEYGGVASISVVLVASIVNACFEELLWRVNLADLFRRRNLVVLQWMFVSTCFGASHLFGTPGGTLGIGFAALFGFAMCVIRALANGSIAWAFLAHFLADTILLGGMYGIFGA